MPSRMTYAPMEVKSVLNPVKAPSMPFEWSINPYRGCQHGCSFCYARSTHAFLGMDTDDTFQHHILYKENARERLSAQLARMKKNQRTKSIRQIAIGTATDPYQPLEAKARLTRECLEVLAEYEVSVSITTRSPLILRDADLLRTMKGSSVNISLNTLDRTVWRQFEPATPSPAKRLEAIRKLSDAGIPVTVFMAPILPRLTDSEGQIESVVKAAAQGGAERIMGSVLRLNSSAVKSWFFQTLSNHYPHLTSSYAGMYSSGAYAPGAYRTSIRERLHRLVEAYGLPSYDPYRQREMDESLSGAAHPLAQEQEQPVQLTFSFD
ncbi:radical SAM protein [Paenibacillus filicis]|uniref:Radical SAM protein n=1 Tax=Paenibacillus gyeongsangnamensis TaxID=3388067 RepID=A0ABT4Q524_9BACL|nr:radical SAM protein [Paenibacillus filicis]MCZ8511967.1 radical SAM protein [Paenibacillus filicis]